MAVAFGAIGAKSAGGTTTVAIPHPASVGAGDLLIAGRVLYQVAGISASDESGWTAGAELRGGTGTSADAHATMAATDYKIAAGGESGDVTFDQSGTVAGCLGIMARYTKGSGTWDVTSATGDDATHAANRSVTTSTNMALAPGDMLVAVVAVDTDIDTSPTSPTFTASGITFGTVNRRTSGAGVTTGNDGNVEVFDVAVSTGTATVAVTFAFTTATSQCGPASFLRIREVATAANVTPNDATHSHAAESPAVTQVHVVAPADGAHAHAAESPAITQTHVVSPADAAHTHTAESPTVAVTHIVAPEDAAHDHSADSPTVTQLHVVSPADGTHTHTAESPAITQAHVVTPDDATHEQAAESPAITQVHVVAPDDTLHDHAAESPTVTSAGDIAPDDATHGHAAESPTITQVHGIAPADALHSHSAESPALTQTHVIAPADSGHGHTADSPAVTQIHTVAPADSLHAHSADSPTVTLQAPDPPPPSRTAVIGAEDRSVPIPPDLRRLEAAEDRTITIPPDLRRTTVLAASRLVTT